MTENCWDRRRRLVREVLERSRRADQLGLAPTVEATISATAAAIVEVLEDDFRE